MTNQASIKYISSLLEHPEQISDGDHNSIALFRQTYPYFVPARYILAAEKHRKVPFTPPMLSEIQPYMGNWLMLCSFLDASTKTVTQSQKSAQSAPGADNFVTNKKSVDIGRSGIEQDRKDSKPAQKVPSFIQPTNANQPKAVPAEIKAEQAKALAAAMNSRPQSTEIKIPPVVSEVNPDPKTEASKPVIPEVKPVVPSVKPMVAEVKPEAKVEAIKPAAEEVKPVMPQAVAEVKPEPKVEAIKTVVEEVKPAMPPVVGEVKPVQKPEAVNPVKEEVKPVVPPVVSEVKPEQKVEVAKSVIEEVKAIVPPVVSEVKAEPKVEAAKQDIEELRAAVPPVVSEVKAKPKVEAAKPVIEEVKAIVPPVVSEVKPEQKAEAAKPVVEEVKAVVPPVVSEVVQDPLAEAAKVFEDLKSAFPVMTGEIKTEPAGDAVKPPAAEIKPVISEVAARANESVVKKEEHLVYTEQKHVFATKLIPVKVTLDNKNEAEDAVLVPQLSEPKEDKPNSELISPVYTEDYFLQQGVKVSEAIPEEIEEFKEVSEEDDEDKSLMVMMSFSEWLLHFKNTTEKQKEEKKDQKALKTMWQKEKLAAAMEEENEEIPENVFEMAVNSITKEDGLASESLADIYIKQGKYDKAIEMYRKLSLRNPKKNAYFARRIEEVLKEKQS
jgi:hypothetical protein